MTAVTNWLEGEQGSGLEKALEVNEEEEEKYLHTVFKEGIVTQYPIPNRCHFMYGGLKNLMYAGT